MSGPPAGPGADPSGRPQVLQRADALLEMKRHRQALEVLAPLIADPGDGAALSRAARALIGLDRYDEALRLAGQAVAAAPDAEWPHRLRSVCLIELSRTCEGPARTERARAAREEARTAVRLGPYAPLAYRNAVRAELNFGDLPAARAAADRVLELAPTDAESWNSSTLVAVAGGDLATAAEHARRAIALDPAHAEAWNNLGVALQRSGRLNEALGAYVQAARLNPSAAHTRGNVARSGLLVLRVVALVLLLPLLLIPAAGAPAYATAVMAAYLLCRPGGPARRRAETWGIGTAMRVERLLRGRLAGAVAFEAVARLVGFGAVVLCLWRLRSSPPTVSEVVGGAAVGCLLLWARSRVVTTRPGPTGWRPRSPSR